MGHRKIDGGGRKMIEVGTLVKFSAPDFALRDYPDYPSFGVVIKRHVHSDKERKMLDRFTVDGRELKVWEVHWINGRTTNEHECYLKEVSHDNL